MFNAPSRTENTAAWSTKIAPQLWIRVPEWLKTLLSDKTLVGAFACCGWYKMIIFLVLLPIFIMIHFSPKTLTILGSSLVVKVTFFFRVSKPLCCSSHPLLLIQPRFAPMFRFPVVHLQTGAVTSTHPLAPNYTVICCVWISTVVFGVLLCSLSTTCPFIIFRSRFTLLMPRSAHTSH